MTKKSTTLLELVAASPPMVDLSIAATPSLSRHRRDRPQRHLNVGALPSPQDIVVITPHPH
ncbi:hypothetical protein L484_024162 [Morus notabilis]|uniref:Uncharacterized protein n=1 Tax=Morus notabilis TaxID=981085 RepID=W9RLX7_9ROSA|nr:hypothetical protein L484_024162 [Morus notabilis]